MELKDQIVAARTAKRMTQEDLAEIANVSKQAVVYWETGTNVPRSGKLRLIEQALGVKLDVTGSPPAPGQINGLPGVRHEDVQLAIAISKLSKSKRDAIYTILELSEDKGSKTKKSGSFFITERGQQHQPDPPRKSGKVVFVTQQAKDGKRDGHRSRTKKNARSGG